MEGYVCRQTVPVVRHEKEAEVCLSYENTLTFRLPHGE